MTSNSLHFRKVDSIKVTITYEVELTKEEIKDYENIDEIVRVAEQMAVSGRGSHQYQAVGLIEEHQYEEYDLLDDDEEEEDE